MRLRAYPFDNIISCIISCVCVACQYLQPRCKWAAGCSAVLFERNYRRA